MPLRVERFGCFGKLPVSREFLVGDARDLSETRFDRWIGEGLGLAKMFLGSRFDEKVTTFPPYWFVWNGGSGSRLLVGKLAPSEDGAGRKHPFSVFAFCDARRANGLAAASCDGLSPAIEELWSRTTGAASPAEVVDLVRREPGLPEIDSRPGYLSFVSSRSAADFWDDVLGDTGDPLRYQIMQAFVETVGPMRSRDPRDIRMGIRFPIASPDTALAAAEAAFWIDMTSRRFGKNLERASCFWSLGGAPGSGNLFVFFTEPSGPQWTCLADRDANIETVSFLDRPYGSDPEKRMEPGLRSLLESPDARLADYLEWAGRSVLS